MTADVLVRRCSLTIRRRDGWSWGAGPQPHIEAALAGIEAAVEAAVEAAGVPAGVDAVLTEPMRLHIDSEGNVTAASWTALVERLRALPAESSGGISEPPAPGVTADPGSGPGAAAEPGDDGGGEAAALARTLARWSRDGQMVRIATAWPAEVARQWIDAIATAAARPEQGVAPASLSAAAVELIAEGVLGTDAGDPDPRPAAGRLLALLAALAAALGDRLPDLATQALARELAAVASVAASPAMAPDATDPAVPSQQLPGECAEEFVKRPMPVLEQVVPALPLLVLAQLSRIGYIDAIVATAAAAGLPLGAGALGAALAGKVLPAPAHGWSRTPPDAAAVAICCGAAADQVPDGLAALAAAEDAIVVPLASALQAAYAEGRSANDELLVWAGDEGIVCGEEAGSLPVAWVVDQPALDAVLASLGHAPVRRDDAFAAFARTLHEHRGLPRLHAPALERQLGVVAGTALGLIALNLWSASGTETTPLLALERLADLEARVRVERDGLQVAIPRGQRWLDLRRGGLLELFAIPWLPGGRLEIGTW